MKSGLASFLMLLTISCLHPLCECAGMDTEDLFEDLIYLQECFNSFYESATAKINQLKNNSECQPAPTTDPIGSIGRPAPSCKDIPSSRPSGHYWIISEENATMVYCQMSPPCSCNASSGWMSVADLDMTQENQTCPQELTAQTVNSKTFCKRNGPGCTSLTFPVNGVRYSKVCGKITGYQYHHPNGFGPYYHYSHSIDGSYVDGVSLTHGQSPRSHIWTFANALDETQTGQYACPCARPDGTFRGRIPPYTGTDYFCATGSRSAVTAQWYTDDPLWDGRVWDKQCLLPV